MLGEEMLSKGYVNEDSLPIGNRQSSIGNSPHSPIQRYLINSASRPHLPRRIEASTGKQHSNVPLFVVSGGIGWEK